MDYLKYRASPRARIIIALAFDLSLLFIAAFYVFLSGKVSIAECAFFTVVHVPCPTCGVTRSLRALFSFDFLKSTLLYPPLILGAAELLFLTLKIFVGSARGKRGFSGDIKLFSILFVPVSIILFFIIRTVMLLGFGFDLLSFAQTL